MDLLSFIFSLFYLVVGLLLGFFGFQFLGKQRKEQKFEIYPWGHKEQGFPEEVIENEAKGIKDEILTPATRAEKEPDLIEVAGMTEEDFGNRVLGTEEEKVNG